MISSICFRQPICHQAHLKNTNHLTRVIINHHHHRQATKIVNHHHRGQATKIVNHHYHGKTTKMIKLRRTNVKWWNRMINIKHNMLNRLKLCFPKSEMM